MEAEETDDKLVLHVYIKPTYEGASEMTDSTSEEVIETIIGSETQAFEFEIGEEFEVPLKCEAEYEGTYRVYSKKHVNRYDPCDPPTSLKSGRYVFEGEAILVLERYDDDGDND